MQESHRWICNSCGFEFSGEKLTKPCLRLPYWVFLGLVAVIASLICRTKATVQNPKRLAQAPLHNILAVRHNHILVLFPRDEVKSVRSKNVRSGAVNVMPGANVMGGKSTMVTASRRAPNAFRAFLGFQID